MIDGVECVITSQAENSISCETGIASAESAVDTDVMGDNGLTREFYNGTNFDVDPTSKQVALNFESPYGLGEHLRHQFKGYFIPPQTGRYRFYQSCDDYCQLRFQSDKGVAIDDTDATTLDTTFPKITWTNTYSGYKDYWAEDEGSTRISEWVTLTKDEPYYLEA